MRNRLVMIGTGLGLVLLVHVVVGIFLNGKLNTFRDVCWIVLGVLILLCWSVGTRYITARPQGAAGSFGVALVVSAVIGFHLESFWVWPFLSAMMLYLADQTLLRRMTGRTRRLQSARDPGPG